MDAKHTPGPWRLGDTERANGGTYQRICDKWGDGLASNIVARVCIAHNFNHELNADGPANARLIAAAPELLEALQRLLPAYREAVKLHDPSHDDAFTVACHNAIAKALGSAQ